MLVGLKLRGICLFWPSQVLLRLVKHRTRLCDGHVGWNGYRTKVFQEHLRC